MIAETDRLTIRPLTVEDAPFVLALVNDPAFLANIGDKGVRDVAGARRFLREGSWTNQPRPGLGQFAVVLKATGAPIGVCGLLYREGFDLTDIGFAFLPESRGQGLAFEAAEAVMGYGRSTLGLTKIVGLTVEENRASVALLERLGLRFEAVVEMFEGDPGTALYS